jgi:hypothetical protein
VAVRRGCLSSDQQVHRAERQIRNSFDFVSECLGHPHVVGRGTIGHIELGREPIAELAMVKLVLYLPEEMTNFGGLPDLPF